jgi:hypothetical protein
LASINNNYIQLFLITSTTAAVRSRSVHSAAIASHWSTTVTVKTSAATTTSLTIAAWSTSSETAATALVSTAETIKSRPAEHVIGELIWTTAHTHTHRIHTTAHAASSATNWTTLS